MTEKSLIPTICECHIERIGVFRALFGGLSMYLTIPMWVLFHFTSAVILYQWLLRPILGLKRVLWKDHVILDRHRIETLALMDKLNCLFCGYANGLTTMLNKEIDNIAENAQEIKSRKWVPLRAVLAVVISVVFLMPLVVICDLIAIRLIYNNLIAIPLGMHQTSSIDAHNFIRGVNYAKDFNFITRKILCYTKNVFLRLSELLEQIESSWCPLKHFETREGIVYPKHHENFIHPQNALYAKEILRTEGTVSPRKPKQYPIFVAINKITQAKENK